MNPNPDPPAAEPEKDQQKAPGTETTIIPQATAREPIKPGFPGETPGQKLKDFGSLSPQEVAERAEANRQTMLAKIAPAQRKRLERSWQSRNQGKILRVWTQNASARDAIECQCLDCCGEDRDAVTACADICCPLWHFRPRY